MNDHRDSHRSPFPTKTFLAVAELNQHLAIHGSVIEKTTKKNDEKSNSKFHFETF